MASIRLGKYQYIEVDMVAINGNTGVYLRRTLSNYLLQKVLTMVPLTATIPEIYFTTMTNFLSNL